MIRPRHGNFVYDPSEIQTMVKTIHRIKCCYYSRISGVVVGPLTANNEVDCSQLQSLIEAARPLSVTFHRAFDHIARKEEALLKLIELNVDRVLTSGCTTNAYDGRFALRELTKMVNTYPTTRRMKNEEDHSSSQSEGYKHDHCSFQFTSSHRSRHDTRTERLVIVAAGRVRAWNVEEIVTVSGVTEVHSSQIFELPKSLSL
jgi:copper homeostasis protein CutC